MTQEDKELLLKDLCARLPHGALVLVRKPFGGVVIEERVDLTVDILKGFIEDDDIRVRPFLRPISSMIEEEMDKLFDILKIDKDGNEEDWIKINDVLGIEFFFPSGKWVENVAEAYDYLYSIHIDFRGLIPMGLALEAKEGMYKNK